MLGPAGTTSFVDFLRTEQPYACNTTHAPGTLDDGGFVPSRIELEEAGPLRAVVRLEGTTSTQEATRIILRLEAYADRSVVRIHQSVEFLHKDPRQALVRRMGLRLDLASVEGAQISAGGQAGPVKFGAGFRAGLKQHSHLGYHAWHQKEGEPFLRFDQIQHRSRGWLDINTPHGGVGMALRNMWQQFPNELVADLKATHLTAYFWPESGPVMDVRRYSNYPHPAQGESTPADSQWIEQGYYSKNPFVGISKTHEVLLYFHPANVDEQEMDAVAADFHRPPLVYAGESSYLDTRVILPQLSSQAKSFDRVNANIDHFARFWLHQQKLWGWYGMWDYGDVQHYYRGGYGSIVPADTLVELLKNRSDPDSEIDVSKWAVKDYAPNHEWAFDNGRWGWSNTEGLLGFYMQQHYMRTGNRDVFFFMEAMAQHVRDVDMRHDGLWYGRGTRHGVQHWSDGNHEERQTTHSEFRYHHYLSGDMRSRDFAQRLYQDIYSQRDIHIHAAHSGRIQGLLTWWEMTGGSRVHEILARYIPCFLVDMGICESPAVDFPDVDCTAQSRDINSGNMFFWTFGAAHGLLEYYYLTQHQGLKVALEKVADHAISQRDMGNFRKAVAFSARHADNPVPYRNYLAEWARQNHSVAQIVPHQPDFYGGSRGMLRGSVPGALFIMNDLPYVLTALEGDPPFADHVWEDVRRIDEQGASQYGVPSVSWQAEYDRSELQDYLLIQHPQP